MNDFKIIFPIFLEGDLVVSPEHLGVAYLKAVLQKHGYDVQITEVRPMAESHKLEEITALQAALVGFTTDSINIGKILSFAEKLKKRNPNLHIVLGGHTATVSADYLISHFPFIDVVVIGEGEETLVELTRILNSQERQHLESLLACQGIVLRYNGQIHKNKARAVVEDLDTLPLPVRDQIVMNDDRLPYIRIASARGCLGNCSFCGNPAFKKRQKGSVWRGRSPEHFVDEIALLVNRYHIHTFDFVDDTFEDPAPRGKERVARICQEIIDRGLDIYFTCRFRSENWSDSDRGLLELMIAAGLEKILIGFESGNQKGLDLFNKKADTEDNLRVLHFLKQFDIYVSYGFINFHPYTRFEDLMDNAQFLKGRIGYNLRRYCTRLELYPGAAISGVLKKDGLLTQDYETLGDIFAYRFQDSRIASLALAMHAMLDEYRAIKDFEIYEIIIFTFISRINKKFKNHLQVMHKLTNFKQQIASLLAELDRNNYEFFMQCTALARDGWDHVAFQTLKNQYIDNFFIPKIETIKDTHLKFGFKLKKMKIDLAKIKGDTTMVK